MKTRKLTGSPTFRNQKARTISPYMAAIIRRNRFIILAIIFVLIFITISWHHRRKESSNKYVDENSEYDNDENEILDSKRKYFFDLSETSGQRSPLVNDIQNLPKNENNEPFVHLITKKDQTVYQVEEFEDIIPPQKEVSPFTTKAGSHRDEKLVLAEKDKYTVKTIQYHENEFSTPPKIGLEVDAKDLEASPSTIRLGKKTVSTYLLEQPVEGFPDPNQEKEKLKGNVTFSMPRGTTDNTDDINKGIVINVNKLSPIKNNADTNTVLLIDTPGCKIPKLDPWDPSVKDLIVLQDPYECPGPPAFMKSNPGGSVSVNKTILETYYNTTQEELDCNYKTIQRMHEKAESDREISLSLGRLTPLKFGIPLNVDFISATCKINDKNYQQYLSLVPVKVKDLKTSFPPPNPTLNIILLGIDSISKLNFLRHFPRTHAFLNEKLKPFEMNGYTKVGDNTFPNLVPLLTGQFVEYWWNETVMNTKFFDDVDFIWKEYAKRGYRTFFAEDSPFSATFNYAKRGFYDPPTDCYFRPMAIALELWKYMLKSEKQFCLDSQIECDFIYDYLKVFTQTMMEDPYFAFAMISTITHDKLNYAGWADEPTERLLNNLLTTGALNNTVLVLFSDHGLRFGAICQTYIGKFEERLPLMYIHFPKWFLEQYPEIEKNLQINQNRLMTLFDIHATMIHLLDLNKSQRRRSRLTLGRSLFEEISPNRTCMDANIESHWCPCQTFDIVSLINPEVINASQAIVDDINSKLKPFTEVCQVLEMDSILDARAGKVDDLMLQYLRTENIVINKTIYVEDHITKLDDYMITLVTKPGGGVFEGTVRHNPTDNSYNVLGVNRISMYGNTSWCIESQNMRAFCYCKIQQPN